MWNEIPPRYTDPDEAAEPDFLDDKSILWTADGYETSELRQALLAICGAKLLREREP